MSAPASNDPTSGRGRHHWWTAAAGVVLVVAGAALWLGQQSGAGQSVAPAGGATLTPSTGTTARATRAHWVPGAPRRIVIPSLAVAAPVLPIEAPGGTLVPPSDPQTLGWWAGGARPGDERGSALVTGHSVHAGDGALDDLETLRRGDAVTVRTDRGWIRYVVRKVAVYSKGRVAEDAQRLFSQEVPGRLVLVTCEDWDGSRYLSNVVVIAAPTAGSR